MESRLTSKVALSPAFTGLARAAVKPEAMANRRPRALATSRVHHNSQVTTSGKNHRRAIPVVFPGPSLGSKPSPELAPRERARMQKNGPNHRRRSKWHGATLIRDERPENDSGPLALATQMVITDVCEFHDEGAQLVQVIAMAALTSRTARKSK